MKIKQFNLGPTGDFPRGKVDPTDKGGLRMAVETDTANAIVRVRFGTAVTWIGLPAREARQLAAMLTEGADHVERQKA